MKAVDVADAGARLPECIEHLDTTPVIIIQGDRPVAALAAVTEDDDLERLAFAPNPNLRRIIAEAREEIERTGGMTHEEFWRAVRERYGRDDASGAEK